MSVTEVSKSRNRCGAALQTGCENKLITPSAHRKQREISGKRGIKIQTNGLLKRAEGAGSCAIRKAEAQKAQAMHNPAHTPSPTDQGQIWREIPWWSIIKVLFLKAKPEGLLCLWERKPNVAFVPAC